LPSPVSFLLVVAEFLLPGYAWILISGLSNRLNFSERFVLAFVLSFSFASLLTAALAFFTPNYLGLSPAISLLIAAVVLIGYVLKRRPPIHQTIPKTKLPSLQILFAVCAYVLLLIALFWSTPHYPTVDAPDLLTHARLAEQILQGGGKEVLLVDKFPTGLHFASALLANTFQLNALDALRTLTALIVLAIIPLIFSTARVLFQDERAAGLTVMIGAFALPVDAFHLARIGTFPNTAGDVLILTVLWLFLSYVRQPNRALGISLAFLNVAGMFMHSSFLIFFAVLWVAAVLVLIFSKKVRRNYSRGLLYSSVGLAVFSPALFYFVQGNVGRVLSSYVDFGQMTDPGLLRVGYFNFLYNIGYLVGWPSFALVALGVVLILKRKHSDAGMVLMLVWTGFLVVAPLLSGHSDRFVLFVMLPATFLVGSSFATFSERLGRARAHMNHGTKKLVRLVIPIMLVVLVLTGSFPTLVPYVYNPYGRTRQNAIFDSMIWLKGSPCASGVASSGLWPDYQYLPALTGIPYAGDFLKPPEIVLQKSNQLNFKCVVVATNSLYFPSFQATARLKQEYQNEMLAVFLIRTTS